MKGLGLIFVEFLIEIDQEKTMEELNKIHYTYQKALEKMAKMSGIELSDEPIPEGFEQDQSSPIVNFILYIFTIEPGFYHFIRKSIEENDPGMINLIGPYIFTLSQIFAYKYFDNTIKSKSANSPITPSTISNSPTKSNISAA